MMSRTSGPTTITSAIQPQSASISSSQSGWRIDEVPRQIESLGEMGSERFHPECFGGVVAPEKKIDSQLLRCDRGPMRRFAGDEGVDSLPGDVVNFGPGAAGNEA